MKVEEQLTELIDKTDLTIGQIAELVGCSRGTIHSIKRTGNGRSVYVDRIRKLYEERLSPSAEDRVEEPAEPYGSEWIKVGKMTRLRLEEMATSLTCASVGVSPRARRSHSIAI